MIKTPITHPDHETVGRWFRGYNITRDELSLFYCDSYDPRIGFWMSDINHVANCLSLIRSTPVASVTVLCQLLDLLRTTSEDRHELRTNVSERAIGRTFHQVYNEIELFHTSRLMRDYRLVLEFICAITQQRAALNYHCAPMPGFSVYTWQNCVAHSYEEARRMLGALEGWQ